MNESRVEAGEAERHPWWLWPNLLSLDAPLVAVAWQWLFAEVFRARLPWAMYVLLGGTVWLIYVFDRLLDVWRMRKGQADDSAVAVTKTARHGFHDRHWGMFAGAAVLVLIALAVATPFFVPGALIARAVFLFVLVGLYFKLVWLAGSGGGISMAKEVFCGAIFALGVTMAPNFYGSLVTNPFPASVKGFFLEWGLTLFDVTLLPTVLFGMLCALNCVAISVWEGEVAGPGGGEAGEMEMARSLRNWLWVLMMAGLIAASVFFLDSLAPVYLCVSGSALGLWLLARKEGALSRNALRALADAVLMTPVLAWVAT